MTRTIATLLASVLTLYTLSPDTSAHAAPAKPQVVSGVVVPAAAPAPTGNPELDAAKADLARAKEGIKRAKAHAKIDKAKARAAKAHAAADKATSKARAADDKVATLSR